MQPCLDLIVGQKSAGVAIVQHLSVEVRRQCFPVLLGVLQHKVMHRLRIARKQLGPLTGKLFDGNTGHFQS